MLKKIFNEYTAGWIAKVLLTIIASLWFSWGVGEMFHEGWWGPFYIRLVYLGYGTAFVFLTLFAIRWPKFFGWVIILFGGIFTFLFMNIKFIDGKLLIGRDISGALVSVPLVFLGILFLIEARNRKQRIENGWQPSKKWWKRNFWYLFAITPPILILIIMSAIKLPVVLSRVDDGNRGIRTIIGNGNTLTWAPEGPGWNWRQDFGGFPSWNRIALYGLDPIGMENKPGYGVDVHASAEDMAKYNLCLYLSEDGLTLEEEPQNIWRMPTIDEYASAFARHGKNAGCSWAGEAYDEMDCQILPDKETPLWAPDLDPIYYWAANERDDRNAYYVSYNGWVNWTIKSAGNPRHSHRCVRDAE
jgi:hypothetical protein